MEEEVVSQDIRGEEAKRHGHDFRSGESIGLSWAGGGRVFNKLDLGLSVRAAAT